MYRVIVMFTDLKDGNHKYEVGDIYPRKGYKPSLVRVKELSTKENKRGIVLIEEVEEKNEPKKKSKKK